MSTPPSLGPALLLGLLQGLTEFLPISSSGHLAAAQLLWPSLDHPGVTLEVALHVGTMIAVLVYYRDLVLRLLRPRAVEPPGEPDTVLEGHTPRHWWTLLLAGTVPTALIGLLARTPIRAAFDSLEWVAAGLFLTGIVLMSTRFRSHRTADLGIATAVAIGVVQGAALLPGLSRSGVTISLALLLGVSQRQAVVFSFLLSVPAVLGATVLDAAAPATGAAVSAGLFLNLSLATLLAAIVGFACIGLVHRATREAWWHHFAWYCWALALALAIAGR